MFRVGNLARRPLTRFLSVAIIACCAVLAPPTHAQEADPPPPPESQDIEGADSEPALSPAVSPAPVSPVYDKLQGSIEEVGPDTFILLDKNGDPQPVLNMSYEEFYAAWKRQQELAGTTENESPTHTLDELRIVGALETDCVRLTANFTITLHTDKTIEVPLALGGTIPERLPKGPPRADGRYLSYRPERGGYFVTLQGEPGETREVELDLIAKVSRDGNRSNLRLLTPRALLSSAVLVSPNELQSVVADERVQLSTKSLQSGGMRIEAIGIGGEFGLSWEDRREQTDQLATVLSATGKLFSTIDGKSIRTQARISVQSFGGPFREVRIRLPPGARYSSPGVSGPIESPIESINENADGDVLLVRLTEDTTGLVTIPLETQQSIGVNEDAQPVELAGFEVLGAVRQHGEIGVRVDDQWQLRWDLSDSVDLVSGDDIDLNWQQPIVAPADVTVALEYISQPWSLKVNLVRRQQRVVATPSYKLSIAPGEAILKMQVDYQINGVRAYPHSMPLTFALEDWQVDKTETHYLENTENTIGLPFDGGEGGGYGEFRAAEATTSQPQVVFTMRQSWRTGQPQLKLALPYPDQMGLTVNTSELTVEADDGLLLAPDLEASSGITPKPIDDSPDNSREGNGGQFKGQRFRYRGFEPRLVFAFGQRPLPQRIVVGVDSQVDFRTEQIEVEQDFHYDVRHQMIDTIELEAPSKLIRQDALELELISIVPGDEARPYPLEYIVDNGAGDDRIGSARTADVPQLRIALPHPRVGPFIVRARYQLPAATGVRDEELMLPLVSPVGGEFDKHRLTLLHAPGQAFAPKPGTSWMAKSSGEPTADKSEYSSAQPAAYLPLAPSKVVPNPEKLEIEQVWVQTWLTPKRAQQRVVFQFEGGGKTVVVELPASLAEGDEVEVTLDGDTVPTTPASEGALQITVPKNSPTTLHTLELRYRENRALGWTESLRVERPRLRGDERLASLYWQIITPNEFCHLRSPEALVKAYQWQWRNGDLRARPELSTSELEQAIRAARRITPTGGEQAYLLRTWDPATPLEASFVRRELLVLAVSSAVLAAGLAVMYLPVLRRLPVLLAVAIAAAVAGLSYPETTALAAQAGFLGALCGLVGVLFYVLLRRSEPPPAEATATSLSSVVAAKDPGTGSLSLAPGSVSSNAPTVAVEMTDSNR